MGHYGPRFPPRYGPPAYGDVPGRPRGPVSHTVERPCLPGAPCGGRPPPPMDSRECLPEGPSQPPAANQEAAQHSGLRGYQVRLSNVPPELTARDLAEAFGRVSQSRWSRLTCFETVRGRRPASRWWFSATCRTPRMQCSVTMVVI